MYLLIIGWVYVVLMMSISEATSSQGTLLGAFFTLLLYGILPLAIVIYLWSTPARRARRRAAEQSKLSGGEASGEAPDGSGHAAGEAVSSEGKEP